MRAQVQHDETTCGLFQDSCRKVAAGYKDISYNEEIVDACAMKMVMYPERFDVVVTTNLFGDIPNAAVSSAVSGSHPRLTLATGWRSLSLCTVQPPI
jgi:isocitrate/isopropylmalate dehydrogenase